MGSALPNLRVPSGAETYSRALEGLVGVDEVILRRNPDLPKVYESGVRYAVPPHGTWRYPHEICRDGWGDCEGLSAWRAAELRVSGADPLAQVQVYKTAPRRYHAIVIRGDGWVEDPSVVLGMKAHAFMPWTEKDLMRINHSWPKNAMIVVGGDDTPDRFPTLDVVKHGDGFSSVFRLPYADETNALFALSSVSPNSQVAAQKGLNLARDVSYHLNDDPYALAQLNPYSAQVAQTLARPDVQASLHAANAVSQQDTGLLAKPGDFLERPGVTNVVQQLGPWGAVAAALINNPLARGARHVSHDVFKHIPLFGGLF